ncbi:helix-turn-helix domain-containing protein [Streptomyces sp. AV19]|uniref:helix-turn-helix domain-containing protein n=1 Tax=Streptomyces sp. AV19 TaxID=2793068 RepID=UPI0018FEF331|nr:helix-turn-helix transcriptional regulator [Streptomyces sp. AV19]MBH1934425.1 helix-turn-helix domain-containing protein [Streptomyces sp. AV19]MDG4533214.1 helix-turn-helix domain-containing protein [Streptomyces sp. AV19]
MDQRNMPTMRSKRLGNELRRLRTGKGLTVSEAAKQLGCGQPKISQIENGNRGVKQGDLSLLLDLYEVGDDKYRQRLKRLALDVYKVDWWTSQGPLIDALGDYLTLESDSSLVRVYEPILVPGLLQTEAYMRELFTHRMAPDRVESFVDTRIKRKEVLDDHLGFRFRTVIDEPALHRIPGPRTLVAEQLRLLVSVGLRPNVTVQVLPMKAKFSVNQFAPFHLFTFRGQSSIDVVWLEHLKGGTLLEQEPEVQAYADAWAELTAAALSPTDSRRFIDALIEENRP